jgi:hypothetical protein
MENIVLDCVVLRLQGGELLNQAGITLRIETMSPTPKTAKLGVAVKSNTVPVINHLRCFLSMKDMGASLRLIVRSQ